MESQVEQAAADKSLTCPGCGHLNPAGLTRCKRCTGPLGEPTAYHYESPFQHPARPGCVTILALLLILRLLVRAHSLLLDSRYLLDT